MPKRAIVGRMVILYLVSKDLPVYFQSGWITFPLAIYGVFVGWGCGKGHFCCSVFQFTHSFLCPLRAAVEPRFWDLYFGHWAFRVYNFHFVLLSFFFPWSFLFFICFRHVHNCSLRHCQVAALKSLSDNPESLTSCYWTRSAECLLLHSWRFFQLLVWQVVFQLMSGPNVLCVVRLWLLFKLCFSWLSLPPREGGGTSVHYCQPGNPEVQGPPLSLHWHQR